MGVTWHKTSKPKSYNIDCLEFYGSFSIQLSNRSQINQNVFSKNRLSRVPLLSLSEDIRQCLSELLNKSSISKTWCFFYWTNYKLIAFSPKIFDNAFFPQNEMQTTTREMLYPNPTVSPHLNSKPQNVNSMKSML